MRRVLTEAVAAAPTPSGGPRCGRGVALARYKNLQSCVAVVCDAEVEPGSGRIRLQHATIAADAGRIIDRDGLANQLEGGFLQAASWTLKEAVRWDGSGISSLDWDSYPVLRFSEVPPVTLRLLDRPQLPSLGAGEAAHGPAAAAIANAVFAAAGVRLRHTPFTPRRVADALTFPTVATRFARTCGAQPWHSRDAATKGQSRAASISATVVNFSRGLPCGLPRATSAASIFCQSA